MERARENGRIPAVFTFLSDSRSLKSGAKRIYSDSDKLSIFEELGIELVILADFDTVKGISPEDFVTRVLLCDLKCRAAHCGFDFRFGRGAAGNAEALAELMARGGAEAVIYEERQRNGIKLSSTAVREALASGRIEAANDMLGAPFFVKGRVERGLGKGRTWGIPTVNLPLPEGSSLKGGVYLTEVEAEGFRGYAITNAGRCPTVKERAPHLEGFILDFDGDIYGEAVRLRFLCYLREEMHFSSTDELARQIKEDEKKAREIIRKRENGEKQ